MVRPRLTLLTFFAGNVVLWVAIKTLVQRGADTLHLGRTSMENEGLRRFKLSWGSEEEVIRYFRFNTVQGDLRKSSAPKIWIS